MCASYVYKRRKQPSPAALPTEINRSITAAGPVNGRAAIVDPPTAVEDDDHLRAKLPACRAQRLTLLGNGTVDFGRASSSEDCSSSSGISPSGSPSSSSFLMTCKVCGTKGSSQRMLICDLCDEAFHFACCKARMVPEDEWYCRPCLRKKPKVLPETLSGQLFYIMSQKKKRRILREKLGPILSMLVDGEPYDSGVRIGKKFQVEVPEWTGPVPDEDDFLANASVLRPEEWWSFAVPQSLGRSARSHSIGNWVQCREMVYNEEDENDEGTICGKWRRAPLFVTQTEEWDCSCALLWDPLHADCAVPQELETTQVLKQLKYIEVLKARLLAKKEDPQGG